jgi:hypothetical protein
VALLAAQAVAESRNLFAFDVCAGDPFLPDASVRVIADSGVVNPEDRTRHLIEMRWPALEAPDDVDGLGEELDEFATRLQCESGYCSQAISWSGSPTWGRPDARLAAMGLREYQLDIHNNDATRYEIGGRCRGARWCTLLSAKLLEQAGGMAALSECEGLGARIRATDSGGVLVFLNRWPRTRVDTRTPAIAAYRALARALEDISLFGDADLERSRFDGNPDLLDRYERRFLE